MRTRILVAAAVFPAAFTGAAAWLAPWSPAAIASAALAVLGWAGFAFLAAWTRAPATRAQWSRRQAAELKELLDAAPKRGKR